MAVCPCSHALCSSDVTTPQWSENLSIGQSMSAHAVKSLKSSRTASSSASAYCSVPAHNPGGTPGCPTAPGGSSPHASAGMTHIWPSEGWYHPHRQSDAPSLYARTPLFCPSDVAPRPVTICCPDTLKPLSCMVPPSGRARPSRRHTPDAEG
eukprot:3859299-Rhodomonas_salina.1